MTSPTDTIAAIATPSGRGGVGIVRVSGPSAEKISRLLLGELPQPRVATFGVFSDQSGESLDTGLAIYFPAPHSFTGEDVLELQGHGGPVVLDRVLTAVIRAGARLARPGEFSERAFLNDKLDLAQAEAIADLIEAGSEQAARAAMHTLQGVFSEKIHQLVEQVTVLRMYVEAAIDFPEEEIDFLSDATVSDGLVRIQAGFEDIIAAARQGAILREGMTVVIAGQPNVGKSSLLNALTGSDRAIVTELPGTTRDVLREHIQIDGMPLHIVDTAGLRPSDDPVEQEGIRRTGAALATADRALIVVDARTGVGEAERELMASLPPELDVSIVLNKIDLCEGSTETGDDVLRVSAKTGVGLDGLRQHLKACMGYEETGAGRFVARRRHLDALDRAREHIERGAEQLKSQRAGELLAEECRLAQQALGEITGVVSSDDLLGRIFSSFCIGK